MMEAVRSSGRGMPGEEPPAKGSSAKSAPGWERPAKGAPGRELPAVISDGGGALQKAGKPPIDPAEIERQGLLLRELNMRKERNKIRRKFCFVAFGRLDIAAMFFLFPGTDTTHDGQHAKYKRHSYYEPDYIPLQKSSCNRLRRPAIPRHDAQHKQPGNPHGRDD